MSGYGSSVLFAAVIGLGRSLVLVTGLHRARVVLTRRPVRRAMDAVTGCALLGFGARLAAARGRAGQTRPAR